MTSKISQILGMNARNWDYLSFNSEKSRTIADSKLITKKILSKAGLPTPKLIKVFKNPQDVENFKWEKLSDDFVLKPVSGYGGTGVVVVKRKAEIGDAWELMDGSLVFANDLKLQALDILAGQYSLHEFPDFAMIEERIKIAGAFKKYAYQGTPDIRVIVFNSVPVMAMLRLPTAESGGRANLHQGAIGVGIDLATGLTTGAVSQGKFIKYLPATGISIKGIKIPNWNKIMELAAMVQEVIPGLGFVGVDIVYDKSHGPMILEINARPGLEIQNANLAPLRKRLDRVEGLEINNANHGVRIAKTLFAQRYVDREMAEEGTKIIGVDENVKIVSAGGEKVRVMAKIDTGAWRTSIDKDLAKKLGLLKRENILWMKTFRSSLGKEKRPVVNLTYYLAGKKIETIASAAKREGLKKQIIIGRRDLQGYLVRVNDKMA